MTGGLLFAFATAACDRSTLPHALDDRAFWALSESLSEPPGSFPLSDNLVSNEPRLAENARWIGRRGGVYIGVGPEQNFTYIARLRPSTAFIIDIRRENRSLHLLYKALFEVSENRADFVSRLFSRAQPAGPISNARELFVKLAAQPPSEELRRRTLALVRERLVGAHGFSTASRRSGLGRPGVAYVLHERTRYPLLERAAQRSGRGQAVVPAADDRARSVGPGTQLPVRG